MFLGRNLPKDERTKRSRSVMCGRETGMPNRHHRSIYQPFNRVIITIIEESRSRQTKWEGFAEDNKMPGDTNRPECAPFGSFVFFRRNNLWWNFSRNGDKQHELNGKMIRKETYERYNPIAASSTVFFQYFSVRFWKSVLVDGRRWHSSGEWWRKCDTLNYNSSVGIGSVCGAGADDKICFARWAMVFFFGSLWWDIKKGKMIHRCGSRGCWAGNWAHRQPARLTSNLEANVIYNDAFCCLLFFKFKLKNVPFALSMHCVVLVLVLHHLMMSRWAVAFGL